MALHKQKVFVLGLDGATLDFIQPMVEAGLLPNLARLIQEGTFGKLRSVIPPNSAPAWVSFATGKNPAKHGVYSFFTPKPGSYDRILVNSHSVRARTLWDLLGEQNRKVVVVGVPITFPPKPVNGVMISGSPLPSTKMTFTYPSTLYAELLVNCGEYLLPQVYTKRFMRRELVEALIETAHYTNSKKNVVIYLMETRPWDFFTVVFSTTDIIQHYTLCFQDELYCRDHPREAEKLRDLIPQVYQKMDRVLGDIWSRLDEDTTLMVMSDHGAQCVESRFFANCWLIHEGFLTLKRANWLSRRRLWETRPRLGDLVRGMSLSKLCLSRLKKARLLVRQLRAQPQTPAIDWHHTKAFADITTSPVFITINLKGRQPQGVVESQSEYDQLRQEIIDRLMLVKDHLGKPIFERVCKREEIYHGPYLEEAPDIEMETVEHRVQLMKDLDSEVIVERARVPLGIHHMDGVIFLYGKHIRPGTELSGAEIVDVAPTILYLIGSPIPDDMDGHVLADAIDPDWLSDHPPQTRSTGLDAAQAVPQKNAMSENEKQYIEKQLESLGYL